MKSGDTGTQEQMGKSIEVLQHRELLPGKAPNRAKIHLYS